MTELHPQIQGRANRRSHPINFSVRSKRALRNRQSAAGGGRKSAVPDQEQKRIPRACGSGERSYTFVETAIRSLTRATSRYRIRRDRRDPMDLDGSG